MVSAQDIKTGIDFVKPFLTVIINPTASQIKNIKRENTKYLIIKSNMSDHMPLWADYIPMSKEIDYDIEKYFWNNFEFENPKKISTLGCICIDNEGIAVGGKKLNLKRTALRIAKFFIYNNQKKFPNFEAVSYFRFITKCPEDNLYFHICYINGRCRENGRPPLIISYMDTYWLNNDYLRYTLEYSNNCYDEFTKVYKK